ncbi:hypothetical protein [Neobacillus cucumis]|nr:hypothetical protein [Neobacillus cucumis]MDR4947166.1 hypothetical protein [Neobacillus cucumis]
MIGSSRPEQVEENAIASGFKIPETLLQDIESVLAEINGFVPIS